MDRYSFTLETDQEDYIAELQKNGDADNQSEAARKLMNHGWRELGYSERDTPQTRLRRIIQRSADGFAICAIVWVGLTMLAPVGYRALAIPLFAVAITLHGVDRAIATHEPRVSRRLAAMLALSGGDNA